MRTLRIAAVQLWGVPKTRGRCASQQKPKNKFKNKDNKTTKMKRKTKENSLMDTKIQLKIQGNIKNRARIEYLTVTRTNAIHK